MVPKASLTIMYSQSGIEIRARDPVGKKGTKVLNCRRLTCARSALEGFALAHTILLNTKTKLIAVEGGLAIWNV